MRSLALLLFLLPLTYSQSSKLPSFKDFPANDTFSGKPAAPILTTANQRTFRTQIREAAAQGPNFAGHFTIADWGCGAGCVSFVVIDEKDGRVYDAPFKNLAPASVKYEGKISSDIPDFEPLDFHGDSRLLIARGCPEEAHCASYFYEWAAPTFKLLRKVDAVPLSK
jgi:hypothetical protein